MTSQSVGRGPLAGLVVVDVSTTLPGCQTSQFLADAGADVIMVEPPGGNPMRRDPGWPALLRTRRSITLDIENDEGDLNTLRGLLAQADVLVSTMRPTTAERIGFTPDALAEKFPRLVAAMVTGWGMEGPFRHYKGYEALINARSGLMHSKRQLKLRPGPAYVTTPYASFGASQGAIQGILAALLERESSGLGQAVESNLVRGVAAYDTYNQFYELVLHRYPGAYQPMDTAYDDEGYPQAYLIYALLIAATKDGTWLQFAQTAPRLMQAWLVELGVAADLADPKWEGFPMLPTKELRTEWWDKMLAKVSERTLEEWQHTFETNGDVSAETYRSPTGSFDHPQVVHDKRVVVVEDPELGPVRQPSSLLHTADGPLARFLPAPRVGEHADELTALAAKIVDAVSPAGARPDGLPLEGITIVEFGVMFAGPFGATLLTDLGARVIKIETLQGDQIRNLVAFPEAGGARVLQGKESLAVDLGSEDGLAIVHEVVKSADVVLQCFRAGAAERNKVDEATLKQLNPDLVYLSAPGYGVEGPYSTRAAYAPSIGAASGISATDAGGLPHSPTDIDDLHRSGRMLHAAGACPAVQADGAAALGVGTSLLLGILARARGVAMDGMVATMLGTAHQALITYNADYEGKGETPHPDPDFYGLNALYRLYQSNDGWVFLAAPEADEWDDLVKGLASHVDLGADERFSTPELRVENDSDLAEVLAGVFAKGAKRDWETDLTAADVGCVLVAEENCEWVIQDDEFFEAGYSVEAVSPIFDEHRRTAPLTAFSRSQVQALAGCTIGQHTKAILAEIGYAEERVVDLIERKVVGV
ncbi:CaiB/BaiF CoA-transferase family protein [Nocardioides panzhihuensis]|uniref:Crotonobetainyl-CoA:carnitine CoA-transferase CaiB-like acyl-CoA transferase n=1 Tax=Nocardioides panzhihuensis TaxID=860243 RepID=A0A7Z0DH86_9ACTN|nr:CoA transferase [Nocardioides panzhihuensis]NYI75524.1 crotonobetainyl-CoA:carnitine CoA-transferase CaiB-like acyl-CoA transferase [Nocardioides panzhihuensis]